MGSPGMEEVDEGVPGVGGRGLIQDRRLLTVWGS